MQINWGCGKSVEKSRGNVWKTCKPIMSYGQEIMLYSILLKCRKIAMYMATKVTGYHTVEEFNW